MKKQIFTLTIFFLALTGCKSQNLQDSIVAGKIGPGSNKIIKEENGTVRIFFRMHNGKLLIDLEIDGKKGHADD